METLRRLLGAAPARSQPPLVDTDEIYPAHMLDDTPTLRSIVVTWMLRFDDVLDADALHASLARLLEIGDWRKLGGRLRLDVCIRRMRHGLLRTAYRDSRLGSRSRLTFPRAG